nr:DUF1524 domain-containing protein [Vibrio agarivorans]
MLTGQYTYRQNEQCIEDIKKLDTFLEGEGNPFISRRKDILNFADCNEEIILRKDEDNSTESSSIKSLVLQYILSKRPYDFTSAGDARLQAWDIAIGKYTVEAHHIVPLTGATSIERSTKEIRSKPNHILNSLMNMTYISREANQAIKDRDAADYLSQLTCYNSVSHMIDQSSISAGFNEEQMIEFVRSRFTLLKSNISSHLDTLV